MWTLENDALNAGVTGVWSLTDAEEKTADGVTEAETETEGVVSPSIEVGDGATTALLMSSNLIYVLSARLTSVVSPPNSLEPK